MRVQEVGPIVSTISVRELQRMVFDRHRILIDVREPAAVVGGYSYL